MSHADAVQARIEGQVADAWGELLSVPAGRLIVWSILEECGLFRTSLGPDPQATAFAEGERHIALKLLQRRVLATDPGALGTMMAEHAERLAEIERALAKDEIEDEHE